MDKKIESLEPYVEKIFELASNYKISVIHGSLTKEGNFPVVTCEGETMEDLAKFISEASKLKATPLVLELTKIKCDEIESIISEIEMDDEPDEERLRELKKALSTGDSIGLCRLTFIPQNISAVFQIEAETSLNNLLYGNNIDEDDMNFGDDIDELTRTPRISEEEIEKHSNELAQNDKFQIASKNAQKLLIAKRIFASHIKENADFPIDQIIEEASAIFEMDLKPSIEEALADRAQKLLDGGMTKKEIAKELGITSDKLSKLI